MVIIELSILVLIFLCLELTFRKTGKTDRLLRAPWRPIIAATVLISLFLNYIFLKKIVREAIEEARVKAEVVNLEWLLTNALTTRTGQTLLSNFTNDVVYGHGTQRQVFSLLQHYVANDLKSPNTFPTHRIIDGEYVDIWAQPFHVAIDHDGDGILRTKEFGAVTNKRVIVWSGGGAPISSLRQ